MYLFTRRVRVRTGGIGEAMAWATGIAEKAQQISGLEVSLYSSVFGPQVGTLAFTTVVPDLEALEAATDKLTVDTGYLDEAAKGQKFAPDGADDRLLQFVHPDHATIQSLIASGEEPPRNAYANVVTTVCAPGELAKGMALGVEIAQRVSAITGQQTSFLADVTGRYGGVNWITGHADAKAVDAAQAALQADADWIQFVDQQVKGVYSDDPNVTEQLLYRRLV